MSQPSLTTVFVFRRHYGRRYTELPVDSVDRDGLQISCDGTHMRPEHYDLRPGDIVRWRSGDRFVEAVISAVRRDERALSADLADARPLPPEYFPY
ncbi:MAG TPA: hypothetical protein PKD53_13970 [Chloroflexaceae bacterium]|nr:hypothetical protein [Chloroflexaceae bacterium]